MTQITIREPKNGELTKSGFTKLIKLAEDQTKESLLEYGFTNYHQPTLYMCKEIIPDISFNISIDFRSLKIKNIDVLDENILQPYDYQRMIMAGSQNEYAIKVYNGVNAVLKKLQEDGIITGFEEGMYI